MQPARARLLFGAIGLVLAGLTLRFAFAPGATSAQAAGPAAPASPSGSAVVETVLLPDSSWERAVPMSPELSLALGTRKHADAVKALQATPKAEIPGAAAADHGFLLAWSLVHADRAAEALPLQELVRASRNAPEPYKLLVLGEALLATGQPVEAAQLLAQVDPSSAIASRARLSQARALFEAGRTADSKASYEALVERADPSPGNEIALWALANRAGLSSPAARPYLVRLYRHYPASSEGRQATAALGDSVSAADKAWRADALMGLSSFKEVNDLLTPVLASFDKPSVEACVGLYAHGRSHFKRNNVTLAAQVLEPAGARCKGFDDDRGGKALYVAGKSLERKKEWAGAARAYEQIPALFPQHSMADDGFALAGIAWQQAGDEALAVQRWESQVRDYPDGDLAAEGFWRLAWTAWLGGDTAKALDWAERSIRTVPINADPVHALGARYWAGRWRVHPTVGDPTFQNPDPVARAEGIERLLALCRDYPTSFYALLAASRLYELAPERLATVSRPVASPDLGGWSVRPQWMEVQSNQWGLALARLGLIREALGELQQQDSEQLSPSEYAIQASILAATEPFAVHDRLHHYLLSHPPETLGPDRDRIIRMAYPDKWWAEVKTATEGYTWDARIFHSLVREESSFNPAIKSWAGAIGLSQLMPATAQSVGGKMGYKVNNSLLVSDPLLNLRIGSRYYQGLVERFKGNLFLSTPSYNAGEGNLEKWIALDPARPTDQFIEALPLRETRHYVKRVMGTWQIYRLSYDEGPTFPDLSAYNHTLR